MSTRLLLITDSALFARTVRRLIESLTSDVEVAHRGHGEAIDDLGGAAEVDPTDAATDAMSEPPITRVLIDVGTRDAVTATARYGDIAATTGLPVACVLDVQDDTVVEALLAAGAGGVMIKSATPQALVAGVELLLAGENYRPAPQRALEPESLPEPLRRRLNGREQKLLRLAMGGRSVADIARELDMTEAKVVHESRRLSELVRGRDGGGPVGGPLGGGAAGEGA